jgi:hypothetical protein
MLQTFSVYVTAMLQTFFGTLTWEALGVEHDKMN